MTQSTATAVSAAVTAAKARGPHRVPPELSPASEKVTLSSALKSSTVIVGVLATERVGSVSVYPVRQTLLSIVTVNL